MWIDLELISELGSLLQVRQSHCWASRQEIMQDLHPTRIVLEAVESVS